MDEKIEDKSLIVINKSDLKLTDINSLDNRYNPISISIKNETNIDKLIEIIKKKLKTKIISTENILITRSRHRQHLEECLKHLQTF